MQMTFIWFTLKMFLNCALLCLPTHPIGQPGALYGICGVVAGCLDRICIYLASRAGLGKNSVW